MGQPFIGQLKIFAGNFAPAGWALCDGQLLSIAENDALFSLIGTTYGGDGQTTFALPDLRGRLPLHQGHGPGLSSRTLGETGGGENVTLTLGQIPSHNHPANASTTGGNSLTPVGNVWSLDPGGENAAYQRAANAQMAPTAIGNAGGSQPHSNLMPYLCVNFIVALFGIFPSQG